MRLPDAESRHRLTAAEHGVLSTMHPDRGVDAVPVVYAVAADGSVGIPVDRVKPKSSLRLRREANLEFDRRAALLVEHWDRDDWSTLWWVRAELRWWPDAPVELQSELAGLLAARHVQYRERPFERILAFRVVGLVGWAAGGD